MKKERILTGNVRESLDRIRREREVVCEAAGVLLQQMVRERGREVDPSDSELRSRLVAYVLSHEGEIRARVESRARAVSG